LGSSHAGVKGKDVAEKKVKALSVQGTAEKPLQDDAGTCKRSVPALLKTSLLFVAFMTLFHAGLWFALPEWKDNFQVQDFISRVVSMTLNTLGVASTAQGNQIILKTSFLIVTQECTGENVIILFTSFVLAYSSSTRSKLIGLVIGISSISVINIVRIVGIGLMSQFLSCRYVNLFHDYIWQTAFLFLVVTMWFIWIEKVVKREKTAAVSR
jgi:archaeosortase B (VPXXXP-CTERM-specific)